MNDNGIIQLYWDRNDQAIKATSDKYGHYCKTIARNILNSEEDAEECVNDTYLNAWNSMPAHWPEQLATFLGKITRNLSFNKYKHDHAEKRGGGEIALVLEELADCVSDTDNVEQTLDRQELVKAINSFVRSLSPEKRGVFVCRYWYADSVSEIANNYGMLQGTVSKTLERTRKQLKVYLTERGFEL
ncbi:sigma-70 family RNA polymerase sigma factor [Pseudoflavonifractor sp. 524-17]|uniref:RNA polymerase sigma factor n=1 Tax=Pseudoflavonifractor sp. 524-17 TaxID=2304577 RepID=UPI00137A1AB4|nr:sigma-70 family RNA polymerase sigma factor [Pseudoflavonifractor sp. 524-17]NCE65313.1 sigma-70 family RNA polymerase sigma factor [Pseudoflavonifractor sp. 524-17]